MRTKIDDDALLKKLAVIITEYPRYTIKELAEAAGISKASLYRLCGTRENLEDLLSDRAKICIKSIVKIAEENYLDYYAAVESLIQIHMDCKEFLVFFRGMQLCDKYNCNEDYLPAMDQFFLRGQQAGAFSIELTSLALTELFISIFCGIIDAERRGRIATANSKKIFLTMFLNGAQNYLPK